MQTSSVKFEYKPRKNHIISNLVIALLIAFFSLYLLLVFMEPVSFFPGEKGPLIVIPAWFIQTLIIIIMLSSLWFALRYVLGLLLNRKERFIIMDYETIKLPRDPYSENYITIPFSDIDEISVTGNIYKIYRIFLTNHETVDVIQHMLGSPDEFKNFEHELIIRLKQVR